MLALEWSTGRGGLGSAEPEGSGWHTQGAPHSHGHSHYQDLSGQPGTSSHGPSTGGMTPKPTANQLCTWAHLSKGSSPPGRALHLLVSLQIPPWSPCPARPRCTSQKYLQPSHVPSHLSLPLCWSTHSAAPATCLSLPQPHARHSKCSPNVEGRNREGRKREGAVQVL
jgi:hypothetical protein